MVHQGQGPVTPADHTHCSPPHTPWRLDQQPRSRAQSSPPQAGRGTSSPNHHSLFWDRFFLETRSQSVSHTPIGSRPRQGQVGGVRPTWELTTLPCSCHRQCQSGEVWRRLVCLWSRTCAGLPRWQPPHWGQRSRWCHVSACGRACAGGVLLLGLIAPLPGPSPAAQVCPCTRVYAHMHTAVDTGLSRPGDPCPRRGAPPVPDSSGPAIPSEDLGPIPAPSSHPVEPPGPTPTHWEGRGSAALSGLQVGICPGGPP